jgi:hypothetical protein
MGVVAAALAPACWYPLSVMPAGLGPGDVTGVLLGLRHGEASGTPGPLPGAHARVEGTTLRAAADGSGRFTLRGLPEGDHVLVLALDGDRDGNPELVRRLVVGLHRSWPHQGLPAVDLGEVVLPRPGSVRGVVTASGMVAGTLGRTWVTVTGTNRITGLDRVTGAFAVSGLTAGPWQVVAAAGDCVSEPTGVEVVADRETRLDELVMLRCPTPTLEETGSIQAALRVLGAGNGASLHLRATQVGGDGEQQEELTSPGFNLAGLRTGLWRVEIRAREPGTPVSPLVVLGVAVLRGRVTDLGTLTLAVPADGCLDVDGDGLCATTPGGPCRAACLAPGRDPEEPCTEVSPAMDCDDDADGQPDPAEESCRCGMAGPDGDGPSCEHDPTRADEDSDGICDMYDRHPHCPDNEARCNPDLASFSVAKAGSGQGTVTSDPRGVDCGGTCAASFPRGTRVALTALPAVDSAFTGFTGDPDCWDGDIWLQGNRSCTATFEPLVALVLTLAGGGEGHVTSSPAGVNCGTACTASFPPGTLVSLTPHPALGSRFSGFTGDADCADGTVTLVEARACTATFDLADTP